MDDDKPKREDYTDFDTFMIALIKYNKRDIEIEYIPHPDDYADYDDFLKDITEYLDKEDYSYKPEEFTFITKLKENKKN